MLEAIDALVADRNRLEAVKLIISLLGLVSLIGIFAALLSMRVNVCNQIYSRWQSLLFKFADADGAHEGLMSDYSRDLKSRTKAHFIATAYLNLFEEAYRYRHARFVFMWRVLPEPFWDSIVKSKTKQFTNYAYIRTLWQMEKASYSQDFNAFIQQEILPQCPKPLPPPDARRAA